MSHVRFLAIPLFVVVLAGCERAPGGGYRPVEIGARDAVVTNHAGGQAGTTGPFAVACLGWREAPALVEGKGFARLDPPRPDPDGPDKRLLIDIVLTNTNRHDHRVYGSQFAVADSGGRVCFATLESSLTSGRRIDDHLTTGERWTMTASFTVPKTATGLRLLISGGGLPAAGSADMAAILAPPSEHKGQKVALEDEKWLIPALFIGRTIEVLTYDLSGPPRFFAGPSDTRDARDIAAESVTVRELKLTPIRRLEIPNAPRPADGNGVIAVEFSVENLGRAEFLSGIDDSLCLTDAEGRRYGRAAEHQRRLPPHASLPDIKPGQTATVNCAFEVPFGTPGLAVRFRPKGLQDVPPGFVQLPER